MYNSLAQKFLLISVISFSMLPAFSQSEVKRVEEVGNRRIITLDVNRVADEISALLAAQDLTASDVTALTAALSGLTWADVLSNGSTSNTDVSLGNNDLSGVSTLTVELISGDSMVVAKVIDGRIGSLSNHDTDDLSEGATNLYFTDARARSSISGGTGVTYTSATGAISIGQSVGTNDDVSFAGVAASAIVTADSISVTDVINGQVNDISNHDTDYLSEGATNHYFTDARARSSISGSTGVTYTSATGAISIGQSVGTTDDVSFAGVAASATVTADSISVTDVINGQVDDISNHDTDDLSEGATNLYFTEARARSSISGGTGVTYTSATGAISIGQSVGITDDVSFAGVAASATVTADSISVTDVINGQVDDISNHDTDDLSEGATNHYFTDARARSSISGSTGVMYTSATGAISIGQSVGTTDDVSFAGVAASATVTADSISVTDVINGQVDDISNHDTDDLSEGATNLYFTDTRARSSISGGTGVTYTSATGAISIGQSVGTADDVSFAGVAAAATVTADSISVTDVINGQVDDISNHDTDYLSEGATNLYFTEARAVSALSDTIAYLIGLIEALQSQTSVTEFTCGTSTVTYQGYNYSTVEIGSQCWFAENLRSTNYNDDTAIPSGLDDETWSTTTEGAVTVYDEGGANAATNLATYGRLYNWHAVNTGKLCPSGWHVPTDAEWTTLTDELGGTAVAGNKMKSSASDNPGWNGTNNSGFSALPGGWRSSYDGGFYNEGNDCYWWSASPNGSLYAWVRYLYSGGGSVFRFVDFTQSGFSVRCVDATSSAAVPTVSTSAASDVADTGATLNGSIDSDGGDAITATGFRWGQAANLSDAQDLAGSATSGSFTGSLTGLAAGTTYYFTAFATNGAGTSYGDTLSFITTAAASATFTTCGDDMTYKGYDYATVEIGSQCWFAENLRSTNYNDDTAIPSGLDDETWSTTTDGAVTVYDEGGSNAATNLATYGRLYNWHAVNTGKLCPSGWHVPTDAEWTTLTDELGGTSVAGNEMKSSASDTPSWNGTNNSGFSALPGGWRYNYNGSFSSGGSTGYWWSASPDGTSYAWYRLLYSTVGSVVRSNDFARIGFSVRCVRD